MNRRVKFWRAADVVWIFGVFGVLLAVSPERALGENATPAAGQGGGLAKQQTSRTVFDAKGWRLSLPGWSYEFPRDHGSHAEFKTEWWYFTGNLKAIEGGREFGFQLTFFRQGIQPELSPEIRSRWAVRDLAFAHFAVSDLGSGQYRHFARWSRGSFGDAGFAKPDYGKKIVWLRDWELSLGSEPGTFFLTAREEDVRLALSLVSEKQPVFHGKDGVSQKAEGDGRASHYYSFTRLRAQGVLQVGGGSWEVSGSAWYDHEWATNQLTEEQEGWDWFCLQFEDGTELMLFQIRRHDGTRDAYSAGTFVRQDGSTLPLSVEDFELEPLNHWRSPKTGGNYPVEWRLEIRPLQLLLKIRAALLNQEFLAPPVIYWEGAIRALGQREGRPVSGLGYLEMTGYGGRVTGMQESAGGPRQ